MAKIVSIGDRFRGKKDDFSEQVPGILPQLGKDFMELLDEIDPTIHILAYLGSLKGSISANALATAREVIRNYSIEELLKVAKESTPAQWSSKPGYYQAIVEAIQAKFHPQP